MDISRRALLTGAGGRCWQDAAREAGGFLGLPLTAAVITADGPGLRDVTGAFAEAYALKGAEAVLVRPDGHVLARLPGVLPRQELRQAADRTAGSGRLPARAEGLS